MANLYIVFRKTFLFSRLYTLIARLFQATTTLLIIVSVLRFPLWQHHISNIITIDSSSSDIEAFKAFVSSQTEKHEAKKTAKDTKKIEKVAEEAVKQMTEENKEELQWAKLFIEEKLEELPGPPTLSDTQVYTICALIEDALEKENAGCKVSARLMQVDARQKLSKWLTHEPDELYRLFHPTGKTDQELKESWRKLKKEQVNRYLVWLTCVLSHESVSQDALLDNLGSSEAWQWWGAIDPSNS